MFLILILACDGANGSNAPAPADPASIRGVGAEATVATEAPGPREAYAALEGRSGSANTGMVTLRTTGTPAGLTPGSATPITVAVRIDRAGPGNHAIFLHETGDCSAPDASSAGTWYGPPSRPRSASPGSGPAVPEDGGPPPGYLGYVTVGADGQGAKELVLTAYTLDESPGSLVGRAVVVYERAPDFTRNGDPGARQACGVIRAEAVVPDGDAGISRTGPSRASPTPTGPGP